MKHLSCLARLCLLSGISCVSLAAASNLIEKEAEQRLSNTVFTLGGADAEDESGIFSPRLTAEKAFHWIDAAYKGEETARHFVAFMAYEGLLTQKMKSQINLNKWFGDLSAWVLEDASRGVLIYKLFPNVFHSSSDLSQEILELADTGGADAQVLVGDLYRRGLVAADDEESKLAKAAFYYSMAAEQKLPRALINLGRMLEKDQVPEEIKATLPSAQKLYQRAVEQGSPRAMRRLGFLKLSKVPGVEYSSVATVEDEYTGKRIKALNILRQAAELGDARAMRILGFQLGLRGVLKGRWNSIPLVEVDESRRWYMRGADLGDIPCMTSIAQLSTKFASGTISKTKIALWLQEAAKLGDPTGMLLLGDAYMCGEGVRLDEGEAKYWYVKSGDLGVIKEHFDYNLLAPYSDEDNTANEALEILHQIAGEYSIVQMRHSPFEQPLDAMTKGRVPKIPELATLHSPVVDLLMNIIGLLQDLENPDLFVNLIQRHSSKSLIYKLGDYEYSYHHALVSKDADAYHLLSFGAENVKKAKQLMGFINQEHPLWIAAQDSLREIRKIHKKTNRSLLAKYQNLQKRIEAVRTTQKQLLEESEKETQTQSDIRLQELSSLKKKLKMRHLATAQAYESAKQEQEWVKKLDQLPQLIKEVILGNLGVRNRLFKEQNPWIEELTDYDQRLRMLRSCS
ncbi:MAG: hypothetical protein ACK5PQ_00175 [Alphaproteobacteria bacterium]